MSAPPRMLTAPDVLPLFAGSDSSSAISASPSALDGEVMALFDQYRSRLLRYIVGFGLPAHDAEEVVQEVFLSLFRHLRIGRSRSNLPGWLFKVAHNLALKRRYADQRLKLVHSEDTTASEVHFDPRPGPEEQLISAQRGRRLLAVIGKLSEQDQCCLRLRAEGLRYREISKILGISLGSVSISLTRSLARLARVAEG
jgi:RNA polymerase sigma-70 factor, ECF subfamily